MIKFAALSVFCQLGTLTFLIRKNLRK